MSRVAAGLVAALMALLRSAAAQASEETLTVTSNVIAPFVGVYPLEANLRVCTRFVLVLNASHFSTSSAGWRARVAAAGAGLSYHPQGSAPRRWYVEAIAEALLASWHHEASPARTSPLVMGSSISALVGYRFVWDAGPVLDLGLGIARVLIPSGRAYVEGEPGSSGTMTRFYPAPKINVGWAF